MFRRQRAQWDPQPTQPALVLLASDGREPFGAAAAKRAAELAGAGDVAVLTIARVYGTKYGLPNPGLFPSRRELSERAMWVDEAIAAIRKAGGRADGQVAATRHMAKVVAGVAMVRGVRTVVVEASEAPTWRRVVEGDLSRELRRRLRNAPVTVEVVDRSTALLR